MFMGSPYLALIALLYTKGGKIARVRAFFLFPRVVMPLLL
jgi:hypothetical protein